MTSSNGPSAAATPRDPAPARGLPVDREELADRVWTVPNALSVLRLLGVPLFLWLLLGPHADGWAIAVLALAGISDWADGKLARLLDQSSRLGALLDPAADRLYIVATLIAFVLRDVVPVWLVLVLLADGDNPVASVAQPIAYALTIWGAALYVLAGVLYVVQAVGLLAGDRRAEAPS